MQPIVTDVRDEPLDRLRQEDWRRAQKWGLVPSRNNFVNGEPIALLDDSIYTDPVMVPHSCFAVLTARAAHFTEGHKIFGVFPKLFRTFPKSTLEAMGLKLRKDVNDEQKQSN